MSHTVFFPFLACPQSFYLPIRYSSIIQKVQGREHRSLGTCVPVLAMSVVTLSRTQGRIPPSAYSLSHQRNKRERESKPEGRDNFFFVPTMHYFAKFRAVYSHGKLLFSGVHSRKGDINKCSSKCHTSIQYISTCFS